MADFKRAISQLSIKSGVVYACHWRGAMAISDVDSRQMAKRLAKALDGKVFLRTSCSFVRREKYPAGTMVVAGRAVFPAMEVPTRSGSAS